LCDVLGQLVVGHVGPGEAHQLRVIPAHEFGERGRVAVLELIEQLAIGTGVECRHVHRP
jgi:hypothetical protein